MKRRTSSSRFSPDGLIIPFAGQQMAAQAFPSYQNINEDNFKNCIVTERGRQNADEKLNTKYGGSMNKAKTGRGSMGSLMAGVPSANQNHHYGIFFTTNTSVKQSNDFSTKDRSKRLKNIKHLKQVCKERKDKELDKYYLPLTDRTHTKKQLV